MKCSLIPHYSHDETEAKLRTAEEFRMTAKDKLYYFFNAPVIIFMYNVVSYPTGILRPILICMYIQFVLSVLTICIIPLSFSL